MDTPNVTKSALMRRMDRLTMITLARINIRIVRPWYREPIELALVAAAFFCAFDIVTIAVRFTGG